MQQMAAIRTEAERLDAASKAATGGQVMPVEPCAVPSRISNGVDIAAFGRSASSWIASVNWKVAVEMARKELDDARTALETQHAANLPAIENNLKVIEQVKLIMSNLGVPEKRTTSAFATPRARKMTTTVVRAGYLDDLAGVCKTTDGYDICVSHLERFARRIDEYQRAEQAKEAAAAQAAQKAQVERDRLTLLGALAHKYGCEADAADIIDAMGKRCKYFHLAYWLQRNRADWNDGPHYASVGLNGFVVESDEDKAIHDDVQGRISDWDGDGRTFRDSRYGYDYLYAKAPAELMADFGKLQDAGMAGFD